MSLLNRSIARIPGTQLLDQHPLPHWIIDQQSLHIVYANRAACDLLGYAEAQLCNMRFTDLLVGRQSVAFVQSMSQPDLNGKLHQQQKKDGSAVLLRLYAAPCQVNGLCYIQISGIVADESQAQELQRFKTYVEQSASAIYCVELEEKPSIHNTQQILHCLKEHGFIIECNKTMANMYGFAHKGELQGMRLSQLIDFNNPVNIAYFENFVANGFKIENALSVEKDKDGNTVYFLNNISSVIENGLLLQLWGTQKDVTALRATEEKVKLLAEMVEESTDILTAADLEFKPITWNKAAERLYGIKAEVVLGKHVRDFLTIHYQNATRSAVRDQVLNQGEWRGEMYFIRPTDQKLITLLAGMKLLKDANGKPLFVIVSCTDITDRKQSELKLKESENRFKELAGSAPVMIWMTDEHGICTYANATWMDFTGIDPLFTNSKEWLSLMHPEDVDRCRAILDYHEGRQLKFDMVYRMRTHYGAYRWVKDVSTPRFLSNRKFLGYIGCLVDIDDQKRREQELRYKEEILESISDIVTVTDPDFRITSINKAGEQAYGLSLDQLRGNRLSEFIHLTFYNSSFDACVNALRNQGFWEGEVSITKDDGTVVYFLHTVKEFYDNNGQKIGYLSIGRDISERRKMEQALIKSEQFYRTLIADSLSGTLLLDDSGLIKFASPAVKNLLGYQPEELLGKTAFNFVSAEDFGWARDSFFREIDENPQFKSITIRLKKKNGEWLWCTVRGHNMLSNPHVNSVVVYFHDDTVRKQANDALKLSEKRFRSVINDLTVGLFMACADGIILMVNQMLCKMLHLPEEAIVGQHVQNFLHIPMVDENEQLLSFQQLPLNDLFSPESIKDYVVGVQHPLTKKRSWVMFNSKTIADDNGHITHAICMLKDVTSRKEMEKKRLEEKISHQRQLTQATIDGQEKERQEIGKELHDNIGQQLTTIKLFLDMIKTTINKDSEEMISLSLKSIGDVINEVRAMSRSLVPHTLKDLGLVESVQELTDSLVRTQSLDINFIHTDFNDAIIPENQQLTLFRIIQEQLNNICKHAQAKSATIQLQHREDHILLKVSDDGKGFDVKNVRKGLGLTNIANRVELFGGRVTMVSELDYGTLISIAMPVAGQSATTVTQP